MGNPFPLKANAGKSFQGSIVLGKGFIITPEQAEELIAKDKRNKDVLFPYLNGDDLNNDPMQRPSRWVINFFDWPEEKARTYPDCFAIVEQFVKPERLAQNDKVGREKWWRFLRPRNELYETISKLDQVIVISEVTKYVSFVFASIDIVFMHTLKVISYSDWTNISILNSSIYSEWAWKYSSTMGSGTLRYTPSTSFETFPFKKQFSNEHRLILESLGNSFYNNRKELMQKLQLGLTKTYNLLHNKELKVIHEQDLKIESKSFVEKYGKMVLQLRNHMQRLNAENYNEFISQFEELRYLLVKIDQTILNIYSWSDIQLRHDFYELEYLPENDRVRFTIHPEARKEILSRLLKLNHQLHAEEVSNESEQMKGFKPKKSTSEASNMLF